LTILLISNGFIRSIIASTSLLTLNESIFFSIIVMSSSYGLWNTIRQWRLTQIFIVPLNFVFGRFINGKIRFSFHFSFNSVRIESVTCFICRFSANKAKCCCLKKNVDSVSHLFVFFSVNVKLEKKKKNGRNLLLYKNKNIQVN